MSKQTFGFGMALGALAGAAAAYLFAPQSGEEFQRDLKDKAQDTKNKAVVKFDEAVLGTEMWLDQKMADNEFNDEPIRYERTPENVAPAPDYTEAPDVFVEEESITD
ncbi:YtxH domain-containing protein [Alkalibacterium olivapovliticus]|uniref:YtxH-like protein n=1 Tax=Alkalibacterium olivapovliticus TaxID=99907 RepID=A0A2T0W968_9LACT|nr:YtxH domain-containing protein [Alkalibacterium olivapovliticus]PRY83249.1 YtxH-like protein [Alkalibacterium olivapovliticus]